MDRSQKTDAVAQLNEVFAQSGVVVVTRNLGLTVDQSTELRTKMREAGATYKVAKNRLAKLALKDTDYTGLEEYLTGPTALGYSEDPVAAAKAVVEHALLALMAPRKPRKSRFDVRTHIHRGIRPSGHPGLNFGVKHHGRYRQAC